jgi:hypothetical protein
MLSRVKEAGPLVGFRGGTIRFIQLAGAPQDASGNHAFGSN